LYRCPNSFPARPTVPRAQHSQLRIIALRAVALQSPPGPMPPDRRRPALRPPPSSQSLARPHVVLSLALVPPAPRRPPHRRPDLASPALRRPLDSGVDVPPPDRAHHRPLALAGHPRHREGEFLFLFL
jgi:hypothetical protein